MGAPCILSSVCVRLAQFRGVSAGQMVFSAQRWMPFYFHNKFDDGARRRWLRLSNWLLAMAFILSDLFFFRTFPTGTVRCILRCWRYWQRLVVEARDAFAVHCNQGAACLHTQLVTSIMAKIA